MSNLSCAPARLLTIAIDGPAGAGKSTVARGVAARLGYTYLDTGAMYRALAWATLNRGIDPTDHATIGALARQLDIRLQPADSELHPTRVFVDGIEITHEIRTPEISAITSPISAIPEVRTTMVALQQEMGARGGIVMEGRDIGTVVFPNADVKVFLTASSHRRAERRAAELEVRGTPIPFAQLVRDIEERDQRDSGRDVAPMVPAADAVILDSDSLSADDVVQQIVHWHREAEQRRG